MSRATRRRDLPPAATWPGRRPIALAVAALIAAATVWWLAARDPLHAAGAEIAGVAPGAASPAGASRARPPAGAALLLPTVAPYPDTGTPGLSTDDPLTAYRRANVYPPTSRPLSRDQVDLLQPGQRHEAMRPDDHGAGITYRFTADRYFVFGDQALTALLEVRRDDAPIAVTITQAYATVVDPGGSPPFPIPMTFAPSGQGATSRFVPAQLGLARQTSISVSIEFDHGDGRQAAHFDVQYTPERGIPARFTGRFSDAIEAGSLVIRAGIDVVAAGSYVIDANLFDAADQPVAWSRFKGELAAGARDAELVFFGKVIVDGKAHGPFHLGQLRGARFVSGLDPDLEQVPPYPGSYATRPYPTDAFSDAEYDSPEKQRMIELLTRHPGHTGGAGRP